VATDIKYIAEPTMERFHACNDFVRSVMGPIGSGKSVGCVVELFNRACQQEPDENGIRHTRGAIVRNSYPELKTTTIKTFQEWLPEEIFKFKWDKPITATCNFVLPDKTVAKCELFFISLDKPSDCKKVLSMELTFAWANEARELDWAVIQALTSRLGRFPGKRFAKKVTWAGMIMDTNPPDSDSMYYHTFEVERPLNWTHFHQPSAMIYNEETDTWEESDEAENVHNIPIGYDYYHNMIGGKTLEWLRVHVEGKYGTITDGRPVYSEFKDNVHTSKEILQPFRGLPLILGFDFGLTPSCVFAQLTPNGQVRIIDEICSESAGIRQFITEAVKPLIAEKYMGMSLQIVGDPAGVARAQTDERTCFEEMELLGMPARPASTNNVMKRLEVVKGRLRTMIDGGPGFLLSPNCDQLRKGFLGNYQYVRVRVTGTTRFKDKPDKNKYSHVHDALQYAMLHFEPKNEQFRGQKRKVITKKIAW